MEPKKCNKDIGEINLNSTNSCSELNPNCEPFTIIKFLKKNSHLFTIMGVIGTMLSLLPNLIDKFIGSDWKFFILDHQTNYLPYAIVEMPLICGGIFLYSIFIIIIGQVIDNRKNEKSIPFKLILNKEGDSHRILFLLLFLPLGFTFSYFLFLVPILQKEIISLLLIFFSLQVIFTIGLALIFSSSQIFEDKKILLGILAITYGVEFYFTLQVIPRFPNEIPYVIYLAWLFLLIVFGEIYLLFIATVPKINPFEKYSKIIILFFSSLATIIIICLFILTILPLVSTPFSESEIYYGNLSITTSPTNYSPIITKSIGIEIWPTGISENKNITKIGLFHLQHHYSTNYGYFLTRDPESKMITVEGQQVKVLTDRPLKTVYWTYPANDIGRQKPPVIINLHIEDKYIQKPLLEDSINITWSEVDVAQVQENPKKKLIPQ